MSRSTNIVKQCDKFVNSKKAVQTVVKSDKHNGSIWILMNCIEWIAFIDRIYYKQVEVYYDSTTPQNRFLNCKLLNLYNQSSSLLLTSNCSFFIVYSAIIASKHNIAAFLIHSTNRKFRFGGSRDSENIQPFWYLSNFLHKQYLHPNYVIYFYHIRVGISF